MAAQRAMTFGVVVGNRGFFPDHLAKSGREEIISVLEGVGARVVVLGPEESKHGAVETYTESQRCAELFKKHADQIDGICMRRLVISVGSLTFTIPPVRHDSRSRRDSVGPLHRPLRALIGARGAFHVSVEGF